MATAHGDVETVYTFDRKVSPGIVSKVLGNAVFTRLPLVRRQDRHDDGSVSTTYYLELTEDQYKALGGE